MPAASQGAIDVGEHAAHGEPPWCAPVADVKNDRTNYSPAMILDRFTVTDQVAIVTGVAGASAPPPPLPSRSRSRRRHCRPYEEQLREVAKRIEATGRRAVVVPGDLSDIELMGSLAQTAWDELGRVDIVINNLGGTMPRPCSTRRPRARGSVPLQRRRRPRPRARRRSLMLAGEWPGVHRQRVIGHRSRCGRGYWPTARSRVLGAVHPARLPGSGAAYPGQRRRPGLDRHVRLDIVMSSDELRTTMEDATPCGESATLRRLRLRSSSWRPRRVVRHGEDPRVDGGLQSVNLEFGLPISNAF